MIAESMNEAIIKCGEEMRSCHPKDAGRITFLKGRISGLNIAKDILDKKDKQTRLVI